MGRSGTSAVAGLFVSAGFFAGRDDDVLAATESNVAGHHENLGVLQTNEEILHELGGWWYDAPDWDSQAAAVDVRPRLAAQLGRLAGEAAGRPLVIKDPRIVMLLPLWAPVLDELLHPVLVVRDPIEVAWSLHRRDGTPLPFGLAMWEMHMTSAIWYLNERTATIAPYARILAGPELAAGVVRAASMHLAPELTAGLDPDRAATALRRELRHNVAAPSDHDELLTVRQQMLWRRLESLEAGDQRVEVTGDLRRITDNVRASVRAEAERVLHEAGRQRLAGELATSAEAVEQLEAELVALRGADARQPGQSKRRRGRMRLRRVRTP